MTPLAGGRDQTLAAVKRARAAGGLAPRWSPRKADELTIFRSSTTKDLVEQNSVVRCSHRTERPQGVMSEGDTDEATRDEGIRQKGEHGPQQPARRKLFFSFQFACNPLISPELRKEIEIFGRKLKFMEIF